MAAATSDLSKTFVKAVGGYLRADPSSTDSPVGRLLGVRTATEASNDAVMFRAWQEVVAFVVSADELASAFDQNGLRSLFGTSVKAGARANMPCWSSALPACVDAAKAGDALAERVAGADLVEIASASLAATDLPTVDLFAEEEAALAKLVDAKTTANADFSAQRYDAALAGYSNALRSVAVTVGTASGLPRALYAQASVIFSNLAQTELNRSKPGIARRHAMSALKLDPTNEKAAARRDVALSRLRERVGMMEEEAKMQTMGSICNPQ